MCLQSVITIKINVCSYSSSTYTAQHITISTMSRSILRVSLSLYISHTVIQFHYIHFLFSHLCPSKTQTHWLSYCKSTRRTVLSHPPPPSCLTSRSYWNLFWNNSGSDRHHMILKPGTFCMSPTHYCSATCSNHCSVSYLWASVFCLLNEDHGRRNKCTLADKVNWVIGHWIQQCNCFLQQNQMNMWWVSTCMTHTTYCLALFQFRVDAIHHKVKDGDSLNMVVV